MPDRQKKHTQECIIMTLFSITDTSDYLNELLSGETSGTVHSVYRKTINLSIGGTLAALQAKGSPISPISLITTLTSEKMESLEISAGDFVTLKENIITIYRSNRTLQASTDINTLDNKREIGFSFEEATIHNLHLLHSLKCANSLSDTILHQLHNNIRTCLSNISTGGFEVIFNRRVNDDTSMMLVAAKKKIERCTRLYRNKKYTETGIELARLIGLGIGLTPSGDDFLCGVLAGLILTGQTESTFAKSLHKTIAEHLNDTVDVSAAFLHCALKGQFSLAVNHLLVIQVVNLHKMLLMLNATLKLLLELQISQQLLKIFWQSGILPGQILCAEFYTHWNYFFFQKCNLYKKFCS